MADSMGRIARIIHNRGYIKVAREAIFEIGFNEDTWERRVDELGIGSWVLPAMALAVADFLRPPMEIPRKPRWKKAKAVERARGRRSAFFWLFDDDPDEFNFRKVCELLDVDVDDARLRLLSMQYFLANRPQC